MPWERVRPASRPAREPAAASQVGMVCFFNALSPLDLAGVLPEILDAEPAGHTPDDAAELEPSFGAAAANDGNDAHDAEVAEDRARVQSGRPELDTARVRPDEVEGYGSTARWKGRG